MRWWQSALACGIVVLLIFLFRVIVRGGRDGFADINWTEIGGIAGLVFAGGCVLGLVFWAFDWLKWRFTRHRR